jgi:hypothetical protein
MGYLGGSPLGLIGVQSRPTRDGMSTFNGGKSRNFNINLYNSGKEGDREKLEKSKLKDGMFSQFTGNAVLKPWANITKTGKEDKDMGVGAQYTGVSRTTLHNNDVYDTSLLNIIEKLSGTRAALRPSDFAYCKQLGVFPNNRLIIARRFLTPVMDNILEKGSGSPTAVLICWRKPDEDFIDITFGEDWGDAEADFTAVLNDIGKDLMGAKIGGGIGDALGAGMGAIPLPGVSEYLTRKFLEYLGIYEKGTSNEPLPAGNPNLIKQAKRRKTLEPGAAGSGLRCTFSVKMTCEYEQKFISGIDPTIAYVDILSNALRFGTSPHNDYGLSPRAAKKIKGWVTNPSGLVKDVADALKTAVETIKVGFEEEIDAIYKQKLYDANLANKEEQENKGKEKTEKQKNEEEREAVKEQGTTFFDNIVSLGVTGIEKTIQKYKEKIYGIAAALSLTPSTPWHVTVGNPLRPIFCSGDMYTTDVQLTLGPTLAFNDLPSNIKIDFTLSPARSWSLTDIMGKFNTGNIRTVNVIRDYKSVNPDQSVLDSPYSYGVTASAGAVPENGNNGNGAAGGGLNKTETTTDGSKTTTKENQEQSKINSDPNSATGPITK